MVSNAFDNTSRGPSEIQTPSNQPLDINHLCGGERNVQNLCATISKTENISNSAMNQFPDLQIYHQDDCMTAQPSCDTKSPSASADSPTPAAHAPTDLAPCVPNVPADSTTPREPNAPSDTTAPSAPNAPSDTTAPSAPNAPSDTTAPPAPNAPSDTTVPTAATSPNDASPSAAPPTDSTPTANNKPCTDATGTPTDASQTTPGDAPAAQGDQSWKSHLDDQWVKDSLKDHPDWHAMEGLHPGEVAVGNWEPTKEEKKIIGTAVDKMMAENNDGPVYVALPDGSICKIEIVKGGHGQSFSKDKDKPETNGRKHRKITFGRPAPTDDNEVCGDESDTATGNPMDQTKTC